MNTLNFHELAIADPYNTDPQFLEAVSNDDALQQIVDEAKRNDQEIQNFLGSVPAPSQTHLDTINAITATPKATVTTLHKRPFQSTKPYLAIAASLFVMTVSFLMFNDGSSVQKNSQDHYAQGDYNHNLMTNALAHETHSYEPKAKQTLATVNFQLARYGARLNTVENVIWSNDCVFEGVKSAHIIYNDDANKVNVYLVAKSESFDFEVAKENFDNDLLNGSITELEKGYLIVIAPKSSDINRFKSKIETQLDWNI